MDNTTDLIIIAWVLGAIMGITGSYLARQAWKEIRSVDLSKPHDDYD